MLRIRLAGANPATRAQGFEELPCRSNYFIGNDPRKWRTDIPNYAKVEYKEICPGVGLVYYGRERRLEHDFIIAAGANPSAITMELRGAEKVSIDRRDDLILESKEGEVRLERPLIYQHVDGGRREVAGGYTLQGQQRVGFDRTWELACFVIR